MNRVIITLATIAVLASCTILTALVIKKASTKSSVNTVTSVSVNSVLENPKSPSLHNKEILSLLIPREQTVVLVGEVGENAFSIAQEISAKALRGRPVFLLISSPGGSVTDGAFIVDAIEASPVPVITVCIDLCASMAAIIHQYGTERLMLDRSVIMFHDAAGGFQGYFPHIRSRFSTIERYIARFNAFIAHRARMSVDELVKAEHTELWVDAEDALGRFADGLAYVQVMETAKKQADMKALLRPPTEPTNTKTEKSTNRKFFDLHWISK